MSSLTIKIECPELADAMNNLAKVLGEVHVKPSTEVPQVTVVPLNNTTPSAAESTAAPVGAPPVIQVAQQPISTVPTPNPVTTAAPTYSLNDIAVAGTALVDAGKMPALMELLGKYGVMAVTQLDPSQYGAFAADLRALGARI